MGSSSAIALVGCVGILVLLAFLIPPDYEGSCAPFSYGESVLHWGDIPCKRGVVNQCHDMNNQSPINLSIEDEIWEGTEDDAILISDEVVFCKELTVVHNKIHFPDACSLFITFAREEYRLEQIHFHVGGSEHTIDSFRFDGELHLVHQGNAGILVMGVFLDSSNDDSNENLDLVLQIYQGLSHRRLGYDSWNPYSLVPSLSVYFRYWGSLTTPPCTSGVHWIVVQEPLAISESQLSQLKDLYPYVPNYRPIQSRGSRKVSHFYLGS